MSEASEEMTIEVQVNEAGNGLFFHEKIGDIEYGDQTAALHRTIPGSSLVLHVGGKRYVVQASDICRSILDKLKE